MSLLSLLLLRRLSQGSLPGQQVTSSLVSPPWASRRQAGRQQAQPTPTSFLPGYLLRASALAAQTEVPQGIRWGMRLVTGQVGRAPVTQARA